MPMTKLDTPQEHYNTQQSTLISTPAEFDFAIDHTMDDHDLMLHHVAQHDPELYAMDCCLAEMLGA